MLIFAGFGSSSLRGRPPTPAQFEIRGSSVEASCYVRPALQQSCGGPSAQEASSNYGELTSAAKLPGFIIEQSGRDEFVDKKNPAQVDIDLAVQGLEKARVAVASGDYDIVILDEVNVALDFALIDIEDVLSLIETRPPHVELVLTGRSAHPNIARAADLVSEVLNIKHHYDAGVEAREGIEF